MRIPLLAASLVLAVRVSAAPPSSAPPSYTALRAARPAAPGLAVSNLVLTRDVLTFTFVSGTFFLLPAVEGRVPGAVFVGSGSFVLDPPSATERQHLAIVGGDRSGKLTDSFDSAVLLFSDGTAAELKAHSTAGDAGALPKAISAFESHLKRQRKDFHTNFHLRVLEDVVEQTPETSGVFLAFVAGKTQPPLLLGYDPGGVDRLGLFPFLAGNDVLVYAADEFRGGFWYLSPSVGAHAKAPRPSPAADALHYDVETTVEGNGKIKGTTTLRFLPAAPGLRFLRVDLHSKLRISSVEARDAADGAFAPLTFVQEAEKEDADVDVFFSTPPKGETLLRIVYEGEKVLTDAGEGNWVVSARDSWYPNLGFNDPATFELAYRVPKANEVVSVGERVGEKVEGALKTARFAATKPIRVAGFNYGIFKRLDRDDKESGVLVQVYTNPGTPDVINEINEALRHSSGGGLDDSRFVDENVSGLLTGTTMSGLTRISIDATQLSDSALVDGVNAARIFSMAFGNPSVRRVAITQQAQWSFGQSWPQLIFIPYLAFIDSGIRHELGLTKAGDFVDLVGFHEMAHQWWGHTVGWAGYRDQWLSEGFAEFSAAYALQQTGGLGKAHRFWENTRRSIVRKGNGAAVAPSEAGPLTLGFRLATSRSPDAYTALVYGKGAYVLHMLRMQMRDPNGKNPDFRFQELMKDFVTRFDGKNASTRDFQDTVEAHMFPGLNATRDGKMDWFFKQWVEGTEIPTYTQKLDVASAGDGKYRITGSLTQSGVSPDFRALLPLYLEFDKGAMLRAGLVPMVGTTTIPVNVELALPKKPKRAVFNAMHDVLARD